MRTHKALLLMLLLTACIPAASAAPCGTPDTPGALECYRMEIRAFLQSWVNAWGKGDYDAYVLHYENVTSPRFGQSRQQWESDRRARLESSGDIEVSLELESMGIDDDGSLDVIFVQSYESSVYRDVVRKQLFLKRSPDGLRIQKEATIE